MGEHETGDDLLQLAAEALRGVLPMSSDGTGHIDCEYDEERNLNCGCIDVLPRAAAAVLEAVLPGVRARAISDVAYQFQMGGWTILTAPPPAGAIPSIALGQRVTDWLRARADEERGTGR